MWSVIRLNFDQSEMLSSNNGLMKSQTSLKVDHVRSKTTSLGKIIEKPCVHSGGHISSLIIMKLGQNVCLDEISDQVETGSCQVKN